MARKSTRSKSPAKKAAPKGMVSADMALLANNLWMGLISMTMLVNPAWLCKQYQVPVTMEGNDLVMALVCFQSWAIWLGLAVGFNNVIRREGNTEATSLACLANLATWALILAVGEMKANAMCADLGMPAEAVNFNRAVGAVMCTLSFLGWQSSGSAKPDLSALTAAPGDAAADALRYSIVLCALFGCMMLYDLDALFDQYGFSSDGDLKKWIGLIFTGMAQALLGTAITLSCTLGVNCTDSMVRWQWAAFIGLFYQGATMNTVNQNILAPDMPADGQYFNLALWFTAVVLAHRSMTGALPYMK